MKDDQALTLTGIAIENETAIVRLLPQSHHVDGIDFEISVTLPEYEFRVRTFYYGYNFDLFLREAEEVVLRRSARAHLFNYNQTLVLEFITEGGGIFLSVEYRCILPQLAEDRLFKVLRVASCLESTTKKGSSFSLAFMPLHNPLSEVSDWLDGILATHPISRENPYPH